MVVDFKTEKGSWAFVKINDTCVKAEIDCKIYTLIYDITNGVSGPIISNQEIDVNLIDFIKDLTKEDWSKVVDDDKDSQGAWYKNYMFKLDEKPPYSLETVKESGKSLMDSLKVYLENPVSQPENPEDQAWIDAWQHCGERTGSWLLIQYN